MAKDRTNIIIRFEKFSPLMLTFGVGIGSHPNFKMLSESTVSPLVVHTRDVHFSTLHMSSPKLEGVC